MDWFSGNIPQAIQLAKSRGSIFVVYVTSEDEATKQMDKMWNRVAEQLKEEKTVAIKIPVGSESCTFFSQIYPVVLVPSGYFIGHNGVPLEVIGGSVESDVFVQKVTAVLEKHKMGEASSSGQRSAGASASAAVDQPGAAVDQPGTSNAGDGEPVGGESKADVKERVERAKEMLEQKKAQKAQEEFEKQRQKEVERRKQGQGVAKLKQFQEEREVKEVRDQLKKEKDEEKRARERIKAEIERDRVERNARFNKEKEERQELQDSAKKAKLLEQQKASQEAEARRSVTARIQFRLPDGSSVSQEFSSNEKLQAAYDFISQRMGGGVTLSTAYPRRTFTQAQMAESFKDLLLTPSAAIIVVPASGTLGGGGGPLGGGVGMGGFFAFLFSPLMLIWNFLMSFFHARPAVTGGNASRRPGTASTSSLSTAAGGDRLGPSGTKRMRQEGNVRRLHDNRDDDDENATWNGNSTQQM